MKKMLRFLLVMPAFFLLSQFGFSSGCHWAVAWCDGATMYDGWCVNTDWNAGPCSPCGSSFACRPPDEF